MIKPLVYSLSFVAMLLFSGLSAQSATDENAIKKTVHDFVAAWNKHDPYAMAALWKEDGDLLTPWGELATDRTDVEKIFVEEQKGKLRKSHIKQSIEYIRFLSPKFAFVDADSILTGRVGNDGKTEDPLLLHVVYVFEKKGDRWLILAARPYQLNQPITKIKN